MYQIDEYHIPVLLSESVDGLNITPSGVYADLTFGGGGHSREILRRLDNNGHLYAFDQDEDAQANIAQDARFTFVRSNFRYLQNFLKYYGVERVDGILADLGVSSHHFDDASRGFTFRKQGAPLDMRMNRSASKTATALLNEYSEEELANLFYLYGELRFSRALATAIVKKRAVNTITTVGDFLALLEPFTRGAKEKKIQAQAFQALRIEVNQEMEALKEMLTQAVEVLAPGGRIAIITYHSLEDRLVKNFFKTGNIHGEKKQDIYGNTYTALKAVNSKVIVPTSNEQEQNPRSRSAKLRIAEKVES